MRPGGPLLARGPQVGNHCLRRSQATEIASIKTESTENYTKLQGNNSVSESLGRRNISSDEHAYIGINEHSYIEKCSDQKNQNSSPFTDCARSFAFWQGLKESVDIFCIRAEKFYTSLLP